MDPRESSITGQTRLLNRDDEFQRDDEQASHETSGLDLDPMDPDHAEKTQETRDKFGSLEELQQAYEAVENQLVEKAQEADAYRKILEEMGADTGSLRFKADEDEFLKAVRQSYEKDPVDAFQMMVTRAQKELWDAVEDRINHVFRQEGQFNKLMGNFFNDPANSALKPYEQEMAFLIKDKGLLPREASELIRKIHEKRDLAGRLRSAAAGEVRNRSMVETGGDAGEPMDRDKEFFRIIKKAKTLDDMFAGLRKTGTW